MLALRQADDRLDIDVHPPLAQAAAHDRQDLGLIEKKRRARRLLATDGAPLHLRSRDGARAHGGGGGGGGGGGSRSAAGRAARRQSGDQRMEHAHLRSDLVDGGAVGPLRRCRERVLGGAALRVKIGAHLEQRPFHGREAALGRSLDAHQKEKGLHDRAERQARDPEIHKPEHALGKRVRGREAQREHRDGDRRDGGDTQDGRRTAKIYSHGPPDLDAAVDVGSAPREWLDANAPPLRHG
jgi:hypothetical protein